MSFRRIVASSTHSSVSHRGVSPMLTASGGGLAATTMPPTATTRGITTGTHVLSGPKRATSSFSRMAAASSKVKQESTTATNVKTTATPSSQQSDATATSGASSSSASKSSTTPSAAPTATKSDESSHSTTTTPSTKRTNAASTHQQSASSSKKTTVSSVRMELESKRLATVGAQLANLLGTSKKASPGSSESSAPSSSLMTPAAQAVLAAMPQSSASLSSAAGGGAPDKKKKKGDTKKGGAAEEQTNIAELTTAQLATITAFSSSTMSPAHTTSSYSHDRGCQVAAGTIPLSLVGAVSISATSTSADAVTCQACLRRRVHNLSSEHFCLSTSRRSLLPSTATATTTTVISPKELSSLSPALKSLLVRSFHNPSILAGKPLGAIKKNDIPDDIVIGCLEEMRRVATRFAASRRDAGYTWVVYNPHYRPSPTMILKEKNAAVASTSSTAGEGEEKKEEGSSSSVTLTTTQKGSVADDNKHGGRLEVVNLPNTMIPNILHLFPVAAFNLTTGVVAEGFLEQSEVGSASKAMSTAPTWSRAARRAAASSSPAVPVASTTSSSSGSFLEGGHISINALSTTTAGPQVLQSALTDIRCKAMNSQWSRLDWSFVESQAQAAIGTYEGSGRATYEANIKARKDAHTLAARVAVMRRYDKIEMDSALGKKKGDATSSKGGKDIDGGLEHKEGEEEETVPTPIVKQRRGATSTPAPTTIPTPTPAAAAAATQVEEKKVDAAPAATIKKDEPVAVQVEDKPVVEEVVEEKKAPEPVVEAAAVAEKKAEVIVPVEDEIDEFASPAASSSSSSPAEDAVVDSGKCADGTTTYQVLKSGITAYSFEDGTEVREHPDGKRVTVDSNTEVTTTQFPDGTLHYLYSNGGTVEHKANGEVYVNGELQEA